MSRATPAQTSVSVALGVWGVAIWVAWGWLGGGHAATAWGAGGALLIAVFATGFMSLPLAGNYKNLRGFALACLAAFVSWNFASIAWAEFPGQAWIGANKTLLYATSFTLLAMWGYSKRAVVTLLGVLVGSVTVIGAVNLLGAWLSAEPGRYFVEGRFVAPLEYANGNVAFWSAAVWPAVALGLLPGLPIVVRGASLAAAALLFDLALLGQSRTWLAVLPFVAALFLLLTRRRLRFALGLVIVAAAVAPTLPSVLAVYGSNDGQNPKPEAIDTAIQAIAVAVVLAGVVGIVVAWIDRRMEVPAVPAPALAIAAVLAVVSLVGAGAAAVYIRDDQPGNWVADRWSEFTCRECGGARGHSRFTGGLSANRYREWTVAWLEFREHPVAGIGSDNYAAAYLRRRPDPLNQPRYPHSTPLRVLSQLGVIGALLFAGFVVAAVVLAVRRRRVSEPIEGSLIGVCLTVFAAWLIHGSFDWFWELPALAAPAFGLLGLAGAPSGSEARRRTTPILAKLALAAVLGAAVVSVGAKWISQEQQDAGARTWQRDPQHAYALLDRAARLDPFSASPLLVKGSIALKRRELATARESLAKAIRREPANWYAHLQLALTQGASGNLREAREESRQARRLNPQDPGVVVANRLFERLVAVNPNVLNGLYLRTVRRLLPPQQ